MLLLFVAIHCCRSTKLLLVWLTCYGLLCSQFIALFWVFISESLACGYVAIVFSFGVLRLQKKLERLCAVLVGICFGPRALGRIGLMLPQQRFIVVLFIQYVLCVPGWTKNLVHLILGKKKERNSHESVVGSFSQAQSTTP